MALPLRALLPYSQTRQLVLDSYCSGMSMEIFILEFLGASFATRSCSDPKAHARSYIREFHSTETGPAYMFSHLADQVRQRGYCHRHKDTVSMAPAKVDIASGGMLCQSFSAMRSKSGTTAKTSTTERHPAFSVVMNEFPEYLDAVKPVSWIMEETSALLQRDPSGERYLDMLVERCMHQGPGYAIRAMMLDNDVWSTLPKTRYSLKLVSSHCPNLYPHIGYMIRLSSIFNILSFFHGLAYSFQCVYFSVVKYCYKCLY
jgi:hypothetical protein